MSEKDILSKKIYGETAIPTGIYKINITYSNKFGKRSWAIRFGGKLPLIEDVKGFEGIRIHPGNTNKDTLGCILVGCNKKVGELINSQIETIVIEKLYVYTLNSINSYYILIFIKLKIKYLL